jgi:hypothetical protein
LEDISPENKLSMAHLIEQLLYSYHVHKKMSKLLKCEARIKTDYVVVFGRESQPDYVGKDDDYLYWEKIRF